jgi:hypothetical protein
MKRTATGVYLTAAILSVTGCTSVHYTVRSAPSPPEHLGAFRLESPDIPAVLQISNFTVGNVDTQYPNSEKALFRQTMALLVPNTLQEAIGKRQVFAQVTRVAAMEPLKADYLMTGHYDFFERLGTQGREWIPFAGFARINEAWVRGTMRVVVTQAKTGTVVLERAYVEEKRDRTRPNVRPDVGYLQADHISAIATDVIEAVKSRAPGSGAEQ